MSERYLGFHFNWIEEWSQFLGGCNWYTFRVFLLEFEDETNLGGFEMTLIILGLGFRARWNYAETELLNDIRKQAAEIKADHE